MSFADVESEGERVPLELFSAQKLRKATDELSLLPKFSDFVFTIIRLLPLTHSKTKNLEVLFVALTFKCTPVHKFLTV